MGVEHPSVRSAPWWLTWLVAGGLALLFIGERILGGSGVVRIVASGTGMLILVGGTVWRLISWRQATGDGKRVESMLLVAYVGCLVAVVGYFVSSTDGMTLLGIDFDDNVAERRYESAVQVFASIVLAISLFPALGAQWALSAHRHAGSSAAQVEAKRVFETAGAALTVALAGSALMLAGYIASKWDKTVDVSYFKTSSPGTGAVEMTRSMGEPLRVLLFFPDVNEVKDEIRGYFRTLADVTGNVELEEYDRMVAPDLARQYTVNTDGAIVLVRGDRWERINFPQVIRSARSRLRTLDQEIQEQLWSLAREQRTAYLTTGHGEYNDPVTEGEEADPLRSVAIIREGLGVLNYKVEDLGLQQGLGTEVPDGAAMVIVLGPQRPFLDEEIATLRRYLASGGSMLFALDPDSDFQLEPFQDQLGITFVHIPLANDRQYVRRRGNESDRQLIITDQFTNHEAVTTLGRTRVGSGVLLLGAGYVDRAEGSTARPRFIVRSLPTTFADLNGNYEFDSSTEVRRSYNLVAAVEGSSETSAADNTTTPDTSDTDTSERNMRVLVYADAGMFSDAVLSSVGLNAALFADGVRWLGGEEAFSGEIASEEDIPVVHTRAEDIALFYSTILGAPLLILGAGVLTVVRRRSAR